MKTSLFEIPIIQPNSGGPKATPKNLKLLYRDVIIPLSAFSTAPVIIVFKQGNNSPVPMLLIVNKPMNK